MTCSGEPISVSLCHCNECQKRTGSAFGIAAFYDREAVEISGSSKKYSRNSDSGYDVTFHFCPDCGSTVYWEPERKKSVLAVAAGAFSDPDFPMPGKQVYCNSRHRWLEINVVEE